MRGLELSLAMDGALTPAAAGWREDDGNEADDEDYLDVRKRLFSIEETPIIKNHKRPVLVYLRVRPKSQLELVNKDQDCLHTVGESEVLAVAPKFSQTYKNQAGSRCQAAEGNHKFVFTRIFDTSTGQKEVFDESILPMLKDFFEGQNCLVFTYGVTNSGQLSDLHSYCSAS